MFFSVAYRYGGPRKCAETFLCACHPFSTALRKLEGFLFYLKLTYDDDIDSDSNEEAGNRLPVNIQKNIFLYVFFESAVESAPQFVIQLFVMNVQEEPVTVIQIISLPVSFLSLAWAFTTVDVELEEAYNDNYRVVKHTFSFFFGTQVLQLSSRRFAICYFTVSYKWGLINVFLLHAFVLTIADTSWVKCDSIKSFFLQFSAIIPLTG